MPLNVLYIWDYGSIHLRAEMAFRAETFGKEFLHRAKTFGTKWYFGTQMNRPLASIQGNQHFYALADFFFLPTSTSRHFSSSANTWICWCNSFSSQIIGEKPDRERSSFSDPRPPCVWALQRDVDLRVSKVHRGRGIHCQDPFLIRPRKVGDG